MFGFLFVALLVSTVVIYPAILPPSETPVFCSRTREVLSPTVYLLTESCVFLFPFALTFSTSRFLRTLLLFWSPLARRGKDRNAVFLRARHKSGSALRTRRNHLHGMVCGIRDFEPNYCRIGFPIPASDGVHVRTHVAGVLINTDDYIASSCVTVEFLVRFD